MKPAARRAFHVALAALVACGAPAKLAPTDTREDTAPSDTGGDTGGDTAADTAGRARCPEGMSLVGDGSPGSYCFSTFESVREEGTGRARSTPGVLPSVPISIDEAAAACGATPVLDAGGNEVGRMRLPTSQEWQDAGDGTLGPGGHPFPYGDTYVEGACATLTADGEQVLDAAVPTQSYPDCVSAWGVYDLVGNLWEWADTGMRIDVAAAFDTFQAAGVDLQVDAEGVLRVPTDFDGGVELRMIGLRTRVPAIAEDGSLRVNASDVQLSDPTQWWAAGYLLPVGADPRVAGSFLPVVFVPVTPGVYDDAYWLTLRADDDGARIPDKRGCAYYTCEGDIATLDVSSVEHNHDFHGTVGFRCVAEPLP